jgi:twitching motility two-component system response regulator PilG
MRVPGRILVIDDDQDYLLTVRDVLTEAGYSVDISSSVGAAIDLLWREWETQPDVILLDLWLPSLDGQTFLELYALLPVRHAPVVLVTGVDEEAAREHARMVGAVGHLCKPFGPDALLACVQAAVAASVAATGPSVAHALAMPDASGRVAL